MVSRKVSCLKSLEHKRWGACAAGGGTVTFGAPMVVYSERPASMYSQLQVQAAMYPSAALLCFSVVMDGPYMPRPVSITDTIPDDSNVVCLYH